MELSLARSINFLVSKPDLLAEVSGNVVKSPQSGRYLPDAREQSRRLSRPSNARKAARFTVMAKPGHHPWLGRRRWVKAHYAYSNSITVG